MQHYMFSSSATWDRSTTHPKVRHDRGSNSRPPDHGSALHVTETPETPDIQDIPFIDTIYISNSF